jgi:hypothetical protein
MNKNQMALRAIPYTLLPITIFSVLPYPKETSDFLTQINITVVWWSILASTLFLFWSSAKVLSDKTDRVLLHAIQYYLLWNIFSIARGSFIAENYWDWKALVGNTMSLMIPIVAYMACNAAMIQAMLRFYFKYMLPLFIIFFFMMVNGAYGFYLVPITFLLLFLPALTLRWKIILLAITLFVITSDLGARSNVIKFSLPIFFSLIYYLKLYISKTLFELIRKLFFIVPILLFCLAVTDTFNVFKMGDYIEGDYETIQETSTGAVDDNLKADTRTFLYIEVLETAEKYNTWLIGRSPARGNESDHFGKDDETGRGERVGNEAAILNIFTWTGLVGLLLHFMVYYKASYLAINRSNNIFLKLLGLFIAFRYLFAWVEDINNFSLTTVFLWLMIGMCFSKSFRAMTNKEFEFWVRGIFNKRLKIT